MHSFGSNKDLKAACIPILPDDPSQFQSFWIPVLCFPPWYTFTSVIVAYIYSEITNYLSKISSTHKKRDFHLGSYACITCCEATVTNSRLKILLPKRNHFLSSDIREFIRGVRNQKVPAGIYLTKVLFRSSLGSVLNLKKENVFEVLNFLTYILEDSEYPLRQQKLSII